MITAGVDEVGRGSLAGPVVACAVILPPDFKDNRITDSKRMAAKKRNSMAKFLMEISLSYAYGVVCNQLIDQINILRATKQAMHRALWGLEYKCDVIISDALKLNNLDIKSHLHPFKAEDKHIEVAAASILAKVYRDSLMEKFHYDFEVYNWFSNKGYGTKGHMTAIRNYGATYLHRRSFLKNV